jgi:hypothetical protein
VSWRELEGKKITQVRPVDQNEVVLELEGGHLVKIRATHPPNTPESEAELLVEIKKPKR